MTFTISKVHRKRVWHVEAGMHCSLLGTCLSMSELYAIAKRARAPLDPKASAYHVHSWFVDHMPFPNDLSKLVDKALEKRHGRAGLPVLRAKTEEELVERWKEVVERGDVAGAYWGAMSHPLCNEQLQWQFFGEIHMLSHVLCASRSTDISKVHDLEVSCGKLDGELAQLKHDHRAVLKDRKRVEEELETRRVDQQRAERRLANIETTTRVPDLEARVRLLESQLAEERAKASSVTEQLATVKHQLLETQDAQVTLAEHAHALGEENRALEIELAGLVVEEPEEEAPPPVDPEELVGKRILCVGGRNNLVQHYRVLVERRGGEFLHHDGGIEESMDAVTRALQTVDAVLCPIDCVSHAASQKVKRACKHLAKQFIPLRSSGLSSFARGIQSVARR